MKSSSKWRNKIWRRGKSFLWSRIRRERKKSGIAKYSAMASKDSREALTWISHHNLETQVEIRWDHQWLCIRRKMQVDRLSRRGLRAEEPFQISIKIIARFLSTRTNIQIDKILEWQQVWAVWTTRLRLWREQPVESTLVTPSTRTDLAYFPAWKEPQQFWILALSTSKGRIR